MDWGDKDIHTLGSGAKTTIFAFAGPADRLGSVGDPFAFMKTLHEQGANTVLMRDRHRAWYQRGVVGVGPGPADVAKLVCNATGPGRRVVTLGMSMGGFAAILFGVQGGADEVIAMSPQTTMKPAHLTAFEDSRFKLHIAKPTWKASSRHLDLANVLKVRQESKTRIRIFYGEHTSADVAHAEHLKTCRNIELSLLSDCDHAEVGARIIHDGIFHKLVEPSTSKKKRK